MKNKPGRSSARNVLWIEGGFCLIILLSWVDELLGLPQFLFGGTHHSNWREAALDNYPRALIRVAAW